MTRSDAEITLFLFSNLHAARPSTPSYTASGTLLPPDPDGMNGERAERAESLINRYVNSTGVDRCDAVADLLNNIIHWCDRNGFVFDDELVRARDYYVDETTEADPM